MTKREASHNGSRCESEPSRSSDLEAELNVAKRICEVVGSPRAQMLWMLITAEEWEQIADLTINPNDYTSSLKFRDDYLVTEVLRKSPNLPLQVDREAAALETFIESELALKESDNRLLISQHPSWVETYQDKVALILGKPELESMKFGFGPGATLSTRGHGCRMSDKYEDKLSMTENLMWFSKAIMGDYWHRANWSPRLVVPHNKFSTVPKTAKTDRGICVEPSLNIYFQKGVGGLIRGRLRRFGLNLDNQADKNRQLARVAYSQGLATIDLSSASDMVSMTAVTLALGKADARDRKSVV